MSFKDKIVLITGGASGIGKASVLEFAKEGAKIILADIQKEKALKIQEDLVKKNHHVDFYHIDISDSKSVDSLMSYIIDKYGSLDIAFNNALAVPSYLDDSIRIECFFSNSYIFAL